jgi:ketosteroid isomerase-like protein
MMKSSQQEIENLEAELALAQVNNDIAVLDRLLADEIIFTDPQGVGSLITKAQDIDLHRDGIIVFTTYAIEDLIVKVYDSTTITNMKVKIVGTLNGESIDGVYRYTRTYLKQNGQWRIIAAQATPIIS